MFIEYRCSPNTDVPVRVTFIRHNRKFIRYAESQWLIGRDGVLEWWYNSKTNVLSVFGHPNVNENTAVVLEHDNLDFEMADHLAALKAFLEQFPNER